MPHLQTTEGSKNDVQLLVHISGRTRFLAFRLNWREVVAVILKIGFSIAVGGLAADGLAQAVPALDTMVEKGGAWALVGLLMWWILGVLSKKLDAQTISTEKLTVAIDKLSDRVHDNTRGG